MIPPLPDSIEDLRAIALEAMQTNPQHDLSPLYRHAMYMVWPRWEKSQRARRWLSIFTAQKVLPLTHEFFWGDTSASVLYAMAVKAARGRFDPLDYRRFTQTLDGCDWFLIDGSGNERPLRHFAAGHSIERAYYEVTLHLVDIQRFSSDTARRADAGVFSKYLRLVPTQDPEGLKIEMTPFLPGRNLWSGDVYWTDAAGLAAFAWASDEHRSHVCDAEKLRAFWTWWLNDALPTAWRRGHESRPLEDDDAEK